MGKNRLHGSFQLFPLCDPDTRRAAVTPISTRTGHSTAWNLPGIRGSKSTCMMGFPGVIPVWLEKGGAENDP